MAVVSRVDEMMGGVLDGIGLWWQGWALAFSDSKEKTDKKHHSHPPESNYLKFVPRNTKFPTPAFNLMVRGVSTILSLAIVGGFISMYVYKVGYGITIYPTEDELTSIINGFMMKIGMNVVTYITGLF